MADRGGYYEGLLVAVAFLLVLVASAVPGSRGESPRRDWFVVRHLDQRHWDGKIIIFPCVTRAVLEDNLRPGDHVYACRHTKGGWRWTPVSPQEFSLGETS